MTSYDLTDDLIREAAAARRRQILDEHFDAMVSGSALRARVEPYRQLTDAVKAKVIGTMSETFPRRLDPEVDETDKWSDSFRQVVAATVGYGRARYQGAPHGDPRPGDKSADAGRPGVVVSGGRGPRPGDTSTVRFHPSTGELSAEFWEEPLDPRFRPFPLDLPGAAWPDGGQSDTFPFQAAYADLCRVRWAPGRPTIFVPVGAPEPE